VKTKLLLLLVMVLMLAVISACEPDEPPSEQPVVPPTDAILDGSPLVGTWLWADSPYYVFEANGRGVMNPGDLESNILWTTEDGILFICTTPEVCGSFADCTLVLEWYYTVSGDNLILDSRTVPGMVLEYIRG
jgi:hypothetical protein